MGLVFAVLVRGMPNDVTYCFHPSSIICISVRKRDSIPISSNLNCSSQAKSHSSKRDLLFDLERVKSTLCKRGLIHQNETLPIFQNEKACCLTRRRLMMVVQLNNKTHSLSVLRSCPSPHVLMSCLRSDGRLIMQPW